MAYKTPAPIKNRSGINQIIFSIIIFLAFFAYNLNFAFAHLTGQSLIQTTDKYIIDVGYDSLFANPAAGQTIAFDYKLYNQPKNDPLDYTDVVVDIIGQNGETAFYSDLRHMSDSPTGMVYVFPKSGSYKFAVHFKNNGQLVAENTFPLTVSQADYEQPSESPKKYWTNFLSGAIVGIIFMGWAIAFWGYLKKRKKR